MKGLRSATCFLLLGIARAAAVQVYLSPSTAGLLPSTLPPEHATLALSRHLGLELFESIGDTGDGELALGEFFQPFVGQGPRDALLLSIEYADAKDTLPRSLFPTFSLSNSPKVSSLTSLISTYLHRAPHIYTSIYSTRSHPPSLGVPRLLDSFTLTASSAATEAFLGEMSVLVDFLESPSELEKGESKFGAFELQGLGQMAKEYGRESEQYKLAAETVSALFSSAFAKENLNLAILTHSSPSISTHAKRQAEKIQPPSQSPLPPKIPSTPIGSVANCYDTQDACTNRTNSCSGRGECVRATGSGRSCFVCACQSTKDDNGRTQVWAGEMCERKDISGPFVLITGTVITLILLIGGSVALLYGIGDEELPSTLTGGVHGGLRKE
ncbi:hypothetical protein JAAARDRAFT_208550 [Jaapia argillacea MUCL 33604]|uniref:Vacuolar sorting protein Vps3844 C-terminal domain-containing protein n=1 Tax=Jaapia argillacea MUCL 33604 TaxID=933084 RepID=A0A067PLK0_9AGAM|nr:hypothetical protein JAAARDRAFT_208550 [Jaapia argillacea MUCL 33604]